MRRGVDVAIIREGHDVEQYHGVVEMLVPCLAMVFASSGVDKIEPVKLSGDKRNAG